MGRRKGSTTETTKKREINKIIPRKVKLKCKNKKQKDYVNLIREKEIVFGSGPAGVGKAQPLDSKILTPNGWTTMGEIKIGDKVIGDDGKPTDVIQVHPQGVIDIYKVTFSDGSSTKCNGEHLWYTETYNDRNFRKKVKGERVFSPRKGSVKTLNEIKNTLYTNRGDKNHSIPIVKPVEFNETEKFIIDPYIIGCLLGDGGLTGSRVTISSGDNEIINEISSELPKELVIDKIPSSKYGYVIKAKNKGIGNNIFLNELSKLELMGKHTYDKNIPKKYKHSSILNRIKLLKGLMDTDGYVNKNGTSCFFTNTSIDLINDVKELVQSLGGVCYLRERITQYKNNGIKLKGHLSYTLTINMPPEINPFFLDRKKNMVKPKTKYKPKRYITGVDYIGKKEAKCITINNDSSLYVTDDYIITHNSFLSISVGLQLLQDNDNSFNKLIIVKPAVEVEENLGFLPGDLKEKLAPYLASSIDIVDKIIGKPNRIKLEESEELMIEPIGFIRGKTIDNSILLLEEAQNTSPKQMKTILTRIGYGSKYIISGDMDQSDKYNDVSKSGLYDAMNRHCDIPELGFFEFDENDIVRNPLITKIVKNYKEEDNLEPVEK